MTDYALKSSGIDARKIAANAAKRVIQITSDGETITAVNDAAKLFARLSWLTHNRIPSSALPLIQQLGFTIEVVDLPKGDSQ